AVILAVIYVDRPLDFNVFPSVLLLVTLLRLALNVASTRVVLLHGHTGPDAAGKVIEAFGEFVIGGNYTVGIVVFVIIVIINFVVVTKGAGRISEVTARFTLDSMPGKQMAIDADLGAGMLTKEEAKHQREEVRMEADFYGSMDGASKFVRGDAIAGILILFINLIGGFIIGVFEYDLEASEAMRNYTLLTIGDGLIAQIPSLVLSTAVAMIVTRMSHAEDVGDQIMKQMFSDSRVLYSCACIMGIMGIVPGMPNVAFLSLSTAAALFAFFSDKKKQRQAIAPSKDISPASTQGGSPDVAGNTRQAQADNSSDDSGELLWADVAQTEVLSLEVGYRLIPLVDAKQAGELVQRIRGIRKKLSQEMGFLYPRVHIRDNLELGPNDYRFMLQGDEVASGSIYPEKMMALNPSGQQAKLPGIETTDPAFNMPAVWIESSMKTQAQSLSYTVVDSATVIATHISEILRGHAAEICGHREVQALLDTLKESDEQLVEALVPTVMNLSRLVQVLQAILREQIPIKNIRMIAQTLTEFAEQAGQDTEMLVARVRESLGRMIISRIIGKDAELPIAT
ncbi:MAG: flagellar biosynthesis protein FlhA, partial [Sinobacterium sp.]|nr:flagellar biosynthesis protein FlhA [Sinobacterium sp.]